MSEDFQVGEVVVCVDVRMVPGTIRTDMPVLKTLYRIEGLVRGDDGRDPAALGLNFAGLNPAPAVGYHHRRFRKLLRADEQFTAQMRACKPQRVGEPA